MLLHAATHISTSKIRKLTLEIVEDIPELMNCNDIRVIRELDNYSVHVHCEINPGIPISYAHQVSERFESRLNERMPNLERVIVHLEPPEESEL